jgi:transposase
MAEAEQAYHNPTTLKAFIRHHGITMSADWADTYVKRNKNDAADAEAICEAVRRPTMRFVQVKSAEQQGRLMQHRTRDLLLRQRTQVINALRGIWPSSELWQRKDARGSRSCLQLLRTKGMPGCPLMRERA